MKKNGIWIGVVIIVLILVGGYLGRHTIKQMFMGTSAPTPTESMQGTGVTPTSAMSESGQATGSAMQQAVVMTNTDASKGTYLTDAKGMTLYTYDKDAKDVSNCSGGCLALWPAFLAASSASGSSMLSPHLSTINRTDGTMQYTWDGMPLYYYIKDTKPGDITGDNVGSVWHIIKQ